MEVRSEIIDCPVPSGTMAILHKRPASDASWPKVVMFHDGPGIRSATHEFAIKLAGAGFDVLVPDLYHRHGRLIGFELRDRKADPTAVDRMRALLATLTDEDIQADLDATLEAVAVGSTERLAVIGFCVGARAVFRTLMRDPDRFVAGAMWHPSFLADDEPDSPHRTADRLARPLYIGIGDADRIQSIEMHRPFFEAVEPLEHVEVEVFEGADHGYSWPGWPSYDENAASRSFAKTVRLFSTHLDVVRPDP